MFLGYTTFYCSVCKRRFTAPIFEYMASAFTAPQKCPHCGSMRTRPRSILPAAIANLKYKWIWDGIEKRNSKR